MSKKHSGTAVGAAVEVDLASPIGSIEDAIERASTFSVEDVERLKASGHAFRGGFQGALDLGSGMQVKGRLDPKESDTLRRLFLSLNRSNARLKDGRHVTTAIDAVRWLLEDATRQIDERIGV